MNRSQTRRNRRVEAHLRLVKPIARHYALRSGEDEDDLLQVGCLGLIRAAGLYDSRKGVPFEAFARPHVRGAILHYLRDNHGLVKLPRRLQEQAQRLIRKPESDGCTPTDALVLTLYRNNRRWSTLDDPSSGVDVAQLAQTNTDGWSDLCRRDARHQLMEQLQRLPAEEQRSIQAVVLNGLSLRQSGQAEGVSAMTIQRRLRSGLKRLAASCRPLDGWLADQPWVTVG